jgi:hypothetical protein
MRTTGLMSLQLAALSVVACGSVAQGGPGDGGPPDAHAVQSSPDGGRTQLPDGGTRPTQDGGTAPKQDGGQVHDDAGSTPVDAGYYHGDGSYFVDGGAYHDAATMADDSGHRDLDAGVDAAPGCGPLAACCGSLPSSSQALCNDIVMQGNAANCATELAQLQSDGECAGVSILASQVQVTPNRMLSDGTLLFWTTASTPGLLAMPVGGGEVTALLDGPLSNTNAYGVSVPNDTLLAVDDVNVYVLMNNALVRIPKRGGSATLVSGSGAFVIDATVLGTTAYWVESPSSRPGPTTEFPLQSAPLLGGPVMTIRSFQYPGAYATDDVAVTSSTAFVGSQGPYPSELFDFPLATAATPASLSASCVFLTSDEDAIYCAQSSGSNVAIASDGTATTLGPAVTSSYIVFDDTYAYWADMTSVGTIMKTPKAGGGTATVIARDATPTAIAVDANSVYWGDLAGYIKSVPK